MGKKTEDAKAEKWENEKNSPTNRAHSVDATEDTDGVLARAETEQRIQGMLKSCRNTSR